MPETESEKVSEEESINDMVLHIRISAGKDAKAAAAYAFVHISSVPYCRNSTCSTGLAA